MSFPVGSSKHPQSSTQPQFQTSSLIAGQLIIKEYQRIG